LTQEFTADIEIETAEIPYPDESPGRKSHRISFSWTKPHPDDASVAFQDHLTHVKKIREKQGARGRSDRSHEFAEELDCVIAKLETRTKDMIDTNVGPNVSSGAAEMEHDENKAEVGDDAARAEEQVCQFKESNASLFKKPRGRPRKGKTWDPVRGCWVEEEKHDEEATPINYRSSHRALSTDESSPLKRPPGPAPDGKYWDPILGDWMLQQDEEDYEETGSRWLAEAEKGKQESAALYCRVFGHPPPPPDAVQRRPRGRAPKGKKWVDHQGWVTDDEGEDYGEDKGEEVEAEVESLSSHPVSGDSVRYLP
jgi:hypothetical protein